MSFKGIVIGCGYFAENHLNGWADADGAEIVAVCDLDRDKAQAMADQFGIARVYTDAVEALETEKPDFADVVTTVESHRMLVELCLEHGAVTICQKPFAETVADARAMVDAADSAGRPLLVHENFRWQRPMIALGEAIRSGAIGTVVFGQISFRHGYDVYSRQPYLAETERLALMDVGLHLFDLARVFLGDAMDIHCRTQSLRAGIAGEDAFTATLRHTNGAVSVVDCSFDAKLHPEPFPQTLVRVEGTDGTLDLTRDYHLVLHKDGEASLTIVEPDVPAWGAKPWHAIQSSVAAFQRHVVDVLSDAAEPQPSGRHNLTTLAMAIAAYASAETGRTIPITEIAEDPAR